MLLKKGSRGDEVKRLQKLLNITVDGVFGDDTEKAVKEYQLKNNLTVDGIVGNKTWNKLTNTSIIDTTKPFIENYFLKPNQYLQGNYSKEYIITHHTASYDNPYSVIQNWDNTPERVATDFVIGGVNPLNGRNIYDGKILRAFPDGNSSYHIGASGSSYMNTHSVGIELTNIGWIKDGRTYVNTKPQPQYIYHLDKPFRGYTEYQKYSDKQLQSLKELLLYISNRDNIDLHIGLYQWIKKEGARAFEFKEEAYKGKVKGLLTHCNLRKDKSDCFPQQELLDMIMDL